MQLPVWLARISLFRAPDTGARGSGKASSGKASSAVGRFRKLKKPVDDAVKVLHNLVPLLQTQRRRTKRCRVVEVGTLVKRIDL